MTTKFFARVELHKATSEQYTLLHNKMEALDFYRFVLDMSPNNNHMSLPTGSYARHTPGVLSEIGPKIRSIADGITILNKVYRAKIEDDLTYLDQF